VTTLYFPAAGPRHTLTLTHTHTHTRA
jgi:hypothetical protein